MYLVRICCIPGIQGRFKIRVNVTYHINRLGENNHLVFSFDSEKVLVEIQHPFGSKKFLGSSKYKTDCMTGWIVSIKSFHTQTPFLIVKQKKPGMTTLTCPLHWRPRQLAFICFRHLAISFGGTWKATFSMYPSNRTDQFYLLR